jgi:hypothetical protein
MKSFKKFITEDAQEFSSASTSINASKLPTAYTTIHREKGWRRGSRHIDVGGGKFDNAVKFLESQGVEGHVYDPFNRTEEHNKEVMARAGKEQSDTASLFNVLNVIREPEYRRSALETAHGSLKPGGRLFVSVYEGDRSRKGRKTKSDAWQNNLPLQDYLEEIKQLFPDAVIQRGVIRGTKKK